MNCRILLGIAAMTLLGGCAIPGMVAPPPVHIYSRAEFLQPGPHQDLKPTGVQEYCAYTYSHKQYAAQMKTAALANIAQACGGENNYSVLREMQAPNAVTVYGAFGTMGTLCDSLDSRAIYFKCNGTSTPPPSSPVTK